MAGTSVEWTAGGGGTQGAMAAALTRIEVLEAANGELHRQLAALFGLFAEMNDYAGRPARAAAVRRTAQPVAGQRVLSIVRDAG